jgi:hypothetical protein
MKQVPWLSLCILFSAYATFSWFFTRWSAHNLKETWIAEWAVWAFVVFCTLMQALLLTTLFDGVKAFFRRWLKSDVGYFSLIIVSALSVTIAMVWFKMFGYFLVLISAEILARLDLQNANLNRWQSLLVLTSISVLGLAAGWSASLHPFSILGE